MIDVLSSECQGVYNISLANKIGLEASIYVSQLVMISNKAVAKNKLVDTFFRLDRMYITSVTTFDVTKQLEIEFALQNLGILIKDTFDTDLMKIDDATLTAYLNLTSDECTNKVMSAIKKCFKVTKSNKDDFIIASLQNHVVTDSADLKKAYYDWINDVYRLKGLTTTAVKVAQSSIKAFCGDDVSVAIAILETASTRGYTDVRWAIEEYKKNPYKPSNFVVESKRYEKHTPHLTGNWV